MPSQRKYKRLLMQKIAIAYKLCRDVELRNAKNRGMTNNWFLPMDANICSGLGASPLFFTLGINDIQTHPTEEAAKLCESTRFEEIAKYCRELCKVIHVNME